MKDNTVQTKFQTSLAPWLMVKVGNSARAMEFYKAVLGWWRSTTWTTPVEVWFRGFL
jgi:predicted enzyme related to lactoylglutathione lyase